MKKKKRSITLLELMIVILIIGLIGAVIGYNMKGSLDRGKVFKTEQAISRVKDLLYLVASEQNLELSKVTKNPETYLEKTGMVKNPEELLTDGWGERLGVKEIDGEIVVTSKGLEAYRKKQK